MKVLALVTYRVFPALMGGQKGITLFYKHLQQHLSVMLVVAKNNEIPKEQTNIIPILYPNKRIFLNVFVSGVLKKLVQQHKPDVIIAEHSYAAWMAVPLRFATGIPFIIHSHNLEGLRFQQMNRWWWRLYRHYECWIHQRADFNFFISKADETYAIKHFKLDAERCTTITYGVEEYGQQSPVDKRMVLKTAGIWGNEKLLYFNGTLDYKPNIDAILILLNQIIPILQKSVFGFKIIITGNRASAALKKVLKRHPMVVFLEYMPDVKPCYKAAQLFINPILNTSGVKTKVIEAIANDCTVISTESGAWGIEKEVCGEKLVTAPDGDWHRFATLVLEQLTKPPKRTNQSFFDTYSWNSITGKAAEKIKIVAQHHGKK